MVKITIKTDNAAFQDEFSNINSNVRNQEIARILRNLASQLEKSVEQGVDWNSVILLDINGNSVGSYTYSPTDEG